MSHKCHAIGCEKEVPPHLLMCFPHWQRVPKRLQRDVWATYRAGQEVDKKPTNEYLEAAARAILAVADKENLITFEEKSLAVVNPILTHLRINLRIAQERNARLAETNATEQAK